VVHLSSGVAGLAAACILGPREEPLLKDDGHTHNVPFVLLGASLLWFGWSGFNSGSAYAANDQAAQALMATYLCASMGMLVWTFIEWICKGHPTSVGAMMGAIAGLVVITPASGYVSGLGALAMGFLGVPPCYLSVYCFQRYKHIVDDTLDAFALHGIGAIMGGMLTGVFALDDGLACGGGFALLGKQAISLVSCGAWAFLVTGAIVLGMKLCVCCDIDRLRVNAVDLDKKTYGEEAYPDMECSARGQEAEAEESEEGLHAEEHEEDKEGRVFTRCCRWWCHFQEEEEEDEENQASCEP